MLQILVALLLMQNVNSFTNVQPQTADTLEKANKVVKIIKIIHGVK